MIFDSTTFSSIFSWFFEWLSTGQSPTMSSYESLIQKMKFSSSNKKVKKYLKCDKLLIGGEPCFLQCSILFLLITQIRHFSFFARFFRLSLLKPEMKIWTLRSESFSAKRQSARQVSEITSKTVFKLSPQGQSFAPFFLENDNF